jgi:hypothetical protein
VLIVLSSRLNAFEYWYVPHKAKPVQAMEKEVVTAAVFDNVPPGFFHPVLYYSGGFWVWHNLPTFAPCN